MAELTPMKQQYNEIKAQHEDCLLFFRLGDFYEMFSEDAVVASSILGLTLTKRQNLPMCGVPYHSVELYLMKLVKAGTKVVLGDPIEGAVPVNPLMEGGEG